MMQAKKDFLSLATPPARLGINETAWLLGFNEHDIPVLIGVGLLKPLGDPPPNAVKYFASIQVLELAGEISRLCKIRNAVYEYWRKKNAAKAKLRYSRNGYT